MRQAARGVLLDGVALQVLDAGVDQDLPVVHVARDQHQFWSSLPTRARISGCNNFQQRLLIEVLCIFSSIVRYKLDTSTYDREMGFRIFDLFDEPFFLLYS